MFAICCFIHYSSKLEEFNFQLETMWKEYDDDYDRSVGLFPYCNLYIMVSRLFERQSHGKYKGHAVPVHAMKASRGIV
jgi:hypothetical protein